MLLFPPFLASLAVTYAATTTTNAKHTADTPSSLEVTECDQPVHHSYHNHYTANWTSTVRWTVMAELGDNITLPCALLTTRGVGAWSAPGEGLLGLVYNDRRLLPGWKSARRRPVVVWPRSTNNDSEDGHLEKRVAKRWSLHIADVRLSDAGVYGCSAHYEYRPYPSPNEPLNANTTDGIRLLTRLVVVHPHAAQMHAFVENHHYQQHQEKADPKQKHWPTRGRKFCRHDDKSRHTVDRQNGMTLSVRRGIRVRLQCIMATNRSVVWTHNGRTLPQRPTRTDSQSKGACSQLIFLNNKHNRHAGVFTCGTDDYAVKTAQLTLISIEAASAAADGIAISLLGGAIVAIAMLLAHGDVLWQLVIWV